MESRRAEVGLAAALRDLGLEPLVEAHDERELERTLASGGRLVGINNRDLRTLLVDPERAVRLRDQVPDDRLAIAESGVRDPQLVAIWRAVGFDAALVGEALVRAADPRAEAARFMAAGRPPSDPANVSRRPFVKICGVTDEDAVLAAVRAGADAIGLNLVPGTPRALPLPDAASLAAVARRSATQTARPTIVAITVDASAPDLAALADALDPDVIQLSGAEPPERVRVVPRPAWKSLPVPPDAVADAIVKLNARLGLPSGLAAMGVERSMYDRIIDGAMADHTHKTNPRLATRDDYARMLDDSM